MKYLDARPDYSDPAKAPWKYLPATGKWGSPDGYKAFDAERGWTAPEIGLTAGDLPVGTPGNDTLVKYLTLFGAKIVWRVIGRYLPAMPAGAITLYTDKIVALRCFDAKEGTGGYYGNSDWGVSNLRQWANSAAGPGQWYSPQHEKDTPPSSDNVWRAQYLTSTYGVNPYESKAGMLYESSQSERDLALLTSRFYGKSTFSSGNYCKDKFFTLTTNELGLETVTGNGTKIAYFTDDNSRIARCSEQCIVDSNYRGDPSTADAWQYWTSTSHQSRRDDVEYVGTDGGLNYIVAYQGNYGVRLACNIPSKTKVSPIPDEDGCYSLLI